MRAPAPHKIEWKKEFKQYTYGANDWNEEYGLEEVLSPEFEGIKSELVYFYPEGLYINYEISKAYYFPNSGYLLVFTHQSMLASGNDTMHGFLLFKQAVASSELSDSERACGALRIFFSLLHDGRYDEAARYCGTGCYVTLQEWNPAVAASDYSALLMYGCKSNGLMCLKIKRILRAEELSPTMFKLTAEFMNDKGEVFAIRGNPESGLPEHVTISEFTYTLKKIGDRFLVEGLPPYLQ